MKKIVVMIIIIAIALQIIAPATVSAEGSSNAVDYSSQLGSDRKIVIEPGDAYLGGGNNTYTNLRIECKEGVNLTIEGLDIDNTGLEDVCAISFTGKNNRLNLKGKNAVISGVDEAGVRVEEGAELIILGDGALEASGGNGGAGIGGSANENVPKETAVKNNIDCGRIVIESGSVYTTGGYEAAGIGGGFGGDGGEIIINGGCIYAKAKEDAAAIGGGSGAFHDYKKYGDEETPYEPNGKGNAGKIRILGGSVTAVASQANYGTDILTIGGGMYGNEGSVEIDGYASVKIVNGNLGETEYTNKNVEFVVGDAYLYGYKEDPIGRSLTLDGVKFKNKKLVHAAIKISNDYPLSGSGASRYGINDRKSYIVDNEGNRGEVLNISDESVIEVFMPEGKYYIECDGSRYEGEYKPLLRSKEFEVKEDIQVTPEIYSVAAGAVFACYSEDSNGNADYVSNGESEDLEQKEFELEIAEGHTAVLWMEIPCLDAQIYLNGKKLGDDIIKIDDEDEGRIIWGLRLDTTVEVKPGNDVIELKVVAGDGITEETYTIHTTSPVPFQDTVWFWMVAGAGTAAALLVIVLIARKMRRR